MCVKAKQALSLSMHKTLLPLMMLLAVFQRSNAQTDSAAKAGQIIKLEQQLADALPGDSLTWKKYLDPTWHIVDEDGNSTNKKEFLAGFGAFPKGVSGTVKVTRPVVMFHDNVAVIQYTADEHETFFGQNLHTTYGTMDTWYKTDTSWMMLAMENYEIPAWPPAIKVNTQLLQQYTGTYQLTDDIKAVVSLKDDTLFLQKNKRKAEPLFAETTNVFFHKSEARGRKIFVKDDAGNMLMRERRNGQDVVWKRVN
jgi:hypothetical protein